MTSQTGFPVLHSAANFRDLGGKVASPGFVLRRGVVFRSELMQLVPADEQKTLADLQIGKVYDLRNPSERAISPSCWQQLLPPSALFVMRDELQLVGADFHQLLQRMGESTFDAQEIGEMMGATYRAMPGHFGPVIRRLLADLAWGRQHGCLVHCTAGKDRTGFVCAMLLLSLDVPMQAIVQDYLASSRFFTVARLTTYMEKLLGHKVSPQLVEVMAPLAQVQTAYLQTALDEIRRQWGSVQVYLHDQAGLDETLRRHLRARLLAPA